MVSSISLMLSGIKCPSLKNLDFSTQISFCGDHFKEEAKKQFQKALSLECCIVVCSDHASTATNPSCHSPKT